MHRLCAGKSREPAAVKAITSFIVLATALGVQAQSWVIDQLWQFSPDPKAQFTAATVDRQAKWRPARASLSWNAQFDDLRDYAGVGWYRVKIALPQPQPSTPGTDSFRCRGLPCRGVGQRQTAGRA